MLALLSDILAIGTQYLCSAALILICTLAGVHLYVMHMRGKSAQNKPTSAPEDGEAQNADLPDHDRAASDADRKGGTSAR